MVLSLVHTLYHFCKLLVTRSSVTTKQSSNKNEINTKTEHGNMRNRSSTTKQRGRVTKNKMDESMKMSDDVTVNNILTT